MAHSFDAEKYEQASSHQRQWGAGLITELDLTGSEHILDIGCGTGLVTEQLADRVPHGSVLGIDSAQSMIDAAHKLERSNLRFQLLDVTASSFRDEFDVVFSNATLHWITDHRQLLKLLHQALKPDGILRANFAAEGNCSNFFRIVRELIDTDTYRRAFHQLNWPWYMPTVDAYQELIGAIPFAEARVWGARADRGFPDADAIVGWIDQPSLVPFRQHVDPELGDRFRNEVVDRMLAETRQEDGTFFETFRRINVLARK